LDVAEVLGSLFPEGFTKIIFSSLFFHLVAISGNFEISTGLNNKGISTFSRRLDLGYSRTSFPPRSLLRELIAVDINRKRELPRNVIIHYSFIQELAKMTRLLEEGSAICMRESIAENMDDVAVVLLLIVLRRFEFHHV
jgi:hypothetical protein